MSRLATWLLVLLLTPALAQAAPRAAAQCCEVPADTMVMVELAGPVSTKTHKPGDVFALRLAEPLVVNGQVLLPAGTPGFGQVVEAAKPGFGGKAAKLVLAARSLQNPHGGALGLKGLQLSGGGRDQATAATALGLGGIGFAPLGFVGIAIHGGNVTFPAGSRATAKLATSADLRPLGPTPYLAREAAPIAEEPEGAIDIPPPPPGEGQIVFFRKKSLLGTGQWFRVREHGKALGKLTNGAYFVQPARPGVHTYTAKTEPEFNDRLKLEVDAGETYFVEGVLSKGVLIGVPALTPADRTAFNAASKALKPSDAAVDDQPKEAPDEKAGG